MNRPTGCWGFHAAGVIPTMLKCPFFASVNLFMLAPEFCWHDLSCLWVLFCFLVEDNAGFFCTFPAPDLELDISPRSPVGIVTFFQREIPLKLHEFGGAGRTQDGGLPSTFRAGFPALVPSPQGRASAFWAPLSCKEGRMWVWPVQGGMKDESHQNTAVLQEELEAVSYKQEMSLMSLILSLKFMKILLSPCLFLSLSHTHWNKEKCSSDSPVRITSWWRHLPDVPHWMHWWGRHLHELLHLYPPFCELGVAISLSNMRKLRLGVGQCHDRPGSRLISSLGLWSWERPFWNISRLGVQIKVLLISKVLWFLGRAN